MENTDKLWGRGKYSKQDLINELKRVAELLNVEYVPLIKFMENSKFSYSPFLVAFGTWGKASIAAGLQQTAPSKEIPEQEILDDIIAVAKKLQVKHLTMRDYNANGKYGAANWVRKYGTWNHANIKAGLITKERGREKKNTAPNNNKGA